MKVKIFLMSQITEADTEAWSLGKNIIHLLNYQDKLYVFYDYIGVSEGVSEE